MVPEWNLFNLKTDKKAYTATSSTHFEISCERTPKIITESKLKRKSNRFHSPVEKFSRKLILLIYRSSVPLTGKTNRIRKNPNKPHPNRHLSQTYTESLKNTPTLSKGWNGSAYVIYTKIVYVIYAKNMLFKGFCFAYVWKYWTEIFRDVQSSRDIPKSWNSRKYSNLRINELVKKLTQSHHPLISKLPMGKERKDSAQTLPSC